jgi:hypothetical protein
MVPLSVEGLRARAEREEVQYAEEHEERDYVFCFFMVRSFGY